MQTQKAINKKRKSKMPTHEEVEHAQMQMLVAKLRTRNLIDARQLKERIIWDNLKSLMLQAHGNTPENIAIVREYEYQFRLAEQAENQYGSEMANYIEEKSKNQ